MMIKIFEKEDYKTIEKWWIDHDQKPCPYNLLPSIGYIVNDMVAGFLYQTDSELCFIESLISDKKSDKEKRSEALGHLFDNLKMSVEEMQYKRVILHTIHPKVKEWGSKYGFQPFNNSQECFFLDIKGDLT